MQAFYEWLCLSSTFSYIKAICTSTHFLSQSNKVCAPHVCDGIVHNLINVCHEAVSLVTPCGNKRHEIIYKECMRCIQCNVYATSGHNNLNEWWGFFLMRNVSSNTLKYSLKVHSSPPSAAFMRQWSVSIGSGNGLSPARRQIIIWTNADRLPRRTKYKTFHSQKYI